MASESKKVEVAESRSDYIAYCSTAAVKTRPSNPRCLTTCYINILAITLWHFLLFFCYMATTLLTVDNSQLYSY
jgi:hypothetical protein